MLCLSGFTLDLVTALNLCLVSIVSISTRFLLCLVEFALEHGLFCFCFLIFLIFNVVLVKHPSMASQVIREWAGINTFAPATQTKLLELLGKLKQEVLFYFIFFVYKFFPPQIMPHRDNCLCLLVLL